MNKIIIAGFAVLAFGLAGCKWVGGIRGDGQITTDQRAIEEFSEIDAGGAFKIVWRNGPPTLSITTDQNLLEYVEATVTDQRLRLRTREWVSPTHGIKIVATSPVRNGAKLSGAVELTATQLSGPKFYFQSSGAAEVELEGNVENLLADMTGASELKAGNLQTRNAEISTTGAADATLAVSDSLKVSITGAGKVTYSGNPSVEKHITGAGSIRKRD